MVELAEKSLRADVIADLRRLKAQGQLRAIFLPMASGAYFPRKERAGTYGAQVEERTIRTIVDRAKAEGEMFTGAADIIFLGGNRGGGAIELKRERQPELFRRLPPGRPSQRQIQFAEECERLNVPHAYCRSVFEVRNVLVAWGMLSLPGGDRTVPRSFQR